VAAVTAWHCTTDGVTDPCGDCDGCRYDQQLAPGTEHVSTTRALVLLALVRLQYPTVRSVAEAATCSVTVAYRQLLQLRDEGMVSWDGPGTLRPTFDCAWPDYMVKEARRCPTS
jgi:hypothetical protein